MQQSTDKFFNLENYSKLLSAACFNGHSKDFCFTFNQTKIMIKKPAFDAEGLFWGSSIQATNSFGILYITSAWINETFQLLVMHQKQASKSFYPLTESSPAWAWQLASDCWNGLLTYTGQATEHASKDPLLIRDLEVFNSQFAPYQAPSSLEALYLFERQWPTQAYAQGFTFYNFNKEGLMRFSRDPKFLSSFIEFASGSADGCFYAYWLIKEKLEDCPIVVFGDESGVHPVAQNTNELISLLTYDSEITCDDLEAYYYKEEVYSGSSDARVAFLNWAKTRFNIDQLYLEEQTNQILKEAKAKYAASLYHFIDRYFLSTLSTHFA